MENQDLLKKVKDLAAKREYSKIKDLITGVNSISLIAAIADILGSTFIGFPITAVSALLLRDILNSQQAELYFNHLSSPDKANPVFYYRLSNYFFVIEGNYSIESNHNIKEIIESIIRIKYGDSVDIQIVIQNGSIKARITLWGAIIFLYMGVANYGSFRAGIREIRNDLDYMTTEIKHKIEEAGYKVREFDGRVGVPAELDDILNKIEEIESTGGLLSIEEKEQLSKLKQRLSNLLAISLKEERLKIMESLKSEELPEPQKEGVKIYAEMFTKREEEEEEI